MLPFWRFPFEITIAGSPTVKTLEAYASAMFPQNPPASFSVEGDALYIPAWRLFTTEAGDKTFADLARAMHGRSWNWTSDRVGLEARPRFVPVVLSEEGAKDLGWTALFGLHTKTSAARLNTLLLKRMLFDAKISLGRGTIAFLEFASEGRSLTRPEVTVPRLLIDGGPALAAQKVSVQAAASAVISSLKRTSVSERVRTSKYSPPSD